MNPTDTKSIPFKCLFSLLVLPFTATYQLSFLWQPNAFLQVVVLGGTLFVFCVSWYRWMWALYAFVFSIPLFNTLTSILELPWPGINVNAILLGALTTSWVYHYIWDKPISDKSPDVYLCRTPLDPVFAILAVALVIALPVGWVRFNNVLCPGFYHEATRQLLSIPFFNLLDNYLCFTRVWQFTQAGIAFYLICSSVRHRQHLRNILWLLAAAGSLVGVYGIVQYFTGYKWVGINWFFERINATLNGPHSAGIYFATLLALCFSLLVATQSYWRKVLLFVAVCLGGIGLWLTGTRTAAFALVIVLVSLAIVLLAMALLKKPKARQVFIVVVAVVLFLGPGYSLIMPTRGPMSAVTQSSQFKRFTEGLRQLKLDSSSINEWLAFRFYHWTAAARVIKSFPVAGAGVGTLDKLYRRVKLQDDTYKTAFAHALYLDVLAELGVIALVGLISLYCGAIILSWKLYRARDTSWRWKLMGLAMLVGLYVTFVANFFTSDFYYVSELQLWFTLLLALVVRNYQMNFDPAPRSLALGCRAALNRTTALIVRSRTRAFAVLAVLILLAVSWLWVIGSSAYYGYSFFRAAQKYTLIDRILEYGIYFYERDKHNNKFARTAASVYKPIRVHDEHLRLFLRAGHPDAEEQPVQATVEIDDILVGEIVLSNRTWKICHFDLSEWLADQSTNEIGKTGIPAVLHFHSSRTWNPYKLRRSNVNCDYGVDLGAIEWGYF